MDTSSKFAFLNVRNWPVSSAYGLNICRAEQSRVVVYVFNTDMAARLFTVASYHNRQSGPCCSWPNPVSVPVDPEQENKL